MEFRADFLVALEAGFGVFARIDDKFVLAPAAGHGDVLAARPVTGFTAVLRRNVLQVQARMRTGRKDPGYIGMAIEARFVADVRGSFNLQGHDDRSVSGAGIEQ